MHHRSRNSVALAAIALALSIAVSTAMTPTIAVGQTSGRITDGTPEVIVVVTRDGTLGSWSSGASGGARWRCGYYEVIAPQRSILDPTPVVDWAGGPVDPMRGVSYMFGCFDAAGERVHTRYVAFDPGDPFAGTAATARAIDEARRRLDLPSPEPRVNPPDAQLVGLPMWMWLDEPWELVRATASIGAVWASVWAWPHAALWEFEDGTRVWCDRGVAYEPWRRPWEQHSECTHTFVHPTASLPDGVTWVRVTVFWRVEWTSSDGAGEPLGTVSRSVQVPIRVLEAQALVR